MVSERSRNIGILRPQPFPFEEVYSSIFVVGVATLYFFWKMFPGMFHLYSCPLKTLTSLPCPTCGTTRMVTALFQGNFAEALRNNPLLFLLVSSLVPVSIYSTGVFLKIFPRFSNSLFWRRNGVRIIRFGAFLLLLNWIFLIVDGR